MDKQSNHTENNFLATLSEEVRLELLNLAVMFRSQMIGKEEFALKAENMGIQMTPESILKAFQLVH